MTGRGRQCRFVLLCAICFLVAGRSAPLAQFQMPDPKQMSGIPRPVTDLPDAAISVRLIRGSLANNITGFPVELHAGSRVLTVKTDDGGRAQFSGVAAGTVVKAIAVVDGERLESQEFPVPAQGGVRLLLVATDKTKGPATEPNAPAVSGEVSLGGQSRIVIEPADEVVRVYYLLEITNTARVPVNPTTPFVIQMPSDALGTSLLEGSSPRASVSGTRVLVAAPFPPGSTNVQIAYAMPSTTGALDIAQRFPAAFEQVALVVKKVGSVRLESPQVARQQEMTAQGEAYIAATGGAVVAGQPLSLTLVDLPHHSPAPRWIALSLAVLIVAIGFWAAAKPPASDQRAADRKQLQARRGRLLNDLARLEADHREGRGDRLRYPARREELLAALEHVYGALDSDDTDPGPADHAGLAA